MKIRRIILIVLDGVGVGELPDAAEFDDQGSNSLAHAAEAVDDFALPNLGMMGLGNLTSIMGVPPCKQSSGAYGKMNERSKGKDSIIGHWELTGICSDKPLVVFPNNFPPALISLIEYHIGRQVIGNIHASGTVIINQLGDEHRRTGKPIVYTSADSVFQVAAHEETISLSELYAMCEKIRILLTGQYNVGRVIARPFRGISGLYQRTEQRRDWAVKPPHPTLLDKLVKAGYEVIGLGKIDEIFAFQGLTQSYHTRNNPDTTKQLIDLLPTDFHGLLFANLIDFDMIYGHRNDYQGYAQALQAFDAKVPEILNHLKNDDLLIITSDHGNDPVTPSTDHSREYVPLLVNGKAVKSAINLGIRSSFADVSASIAEAFNLPDKEIGESFISEVLLG